MFDDACPHRLAPLSDGRIDKLGRLQCAYHGWCFNGSGHCKLIPQATPDGPPVITHSTFIKTFLVSILVSCFRVEKKVSKSYIVGLKRVNRSTVYVNIIRNLDTRV